MMHTQDAVLSVSGKKGWLVAVCLAGLAAGSGCVEGLLDLCELGFGQPIADAGASRNAQIGSMVVLSGVSSTDPDGDALTYQWEQTGGPAIEMINPHGMESSFVPLADGNYAFALTVSDGCNQDTATVRIAVGEALQSHCPVANAGQDQLVNEGRSVCINGGNSSDPDGSALSYEWTILSGPDVDMGNPFLEEFCMTAGEVCGDQKVVLELAVTNDTECRMTDEVVVTIRDLDGDCCQSDEECDDGRLCTIDSCDSDHQCPFVELECANGCDEVTGTCIEQTDDPPAQPDPDSNPQPDCAPPSIEATFDDGDEGWTYINAHKGSGSPDWSSAGGNPGGHVSVEDKGGKLFYWLAPADFISHVCEEHYGGMLSFQLVENKNGQARSSMHDVMLQGAGVQLYYDLPVYPGTTWRAYAVALEVGGGLKNEFTGFAATEQEIRTVLKHLDSLQIRGEFRTDLSIGSLDNVAIDPPGI